MIPGQEVPSVFLKESVSRVLGRKVRCQVFLFRGGGRVPGILTEMVIGMVSKNIIIIREGKASCRRHRKTLGTGSVQSLTNSQ